MSNSNNELDATVFEIKKIPGILVKLYQDLVLILAFNVGLIIGSPKFFTRYWLAIEMIMILFLVIKALRKRNRQVYKLVFNESLQMLTIEFFHFGKLKSSSIIPYNLLAYSYKHKFYGRGKIPLTLEIFNNKKFCAEIRHKYNLGWKDSEIAEIKNMISQVASKELSQTGPKDLNVQLKVNKIS